MGVRGLTSYIARNAEQYLSPHELHDCDLVIDGDNLACNLFKDVSGSNPAFGGDYDALYRTYIHFFQLLKECNVRPFILMDGGYESKKLKTLEQRLRSKIGMVKHLNPNQSKPLFPLMMREVLIDAAKDSGLQVMRCIFEADDELAVLARQLNCPVLSYDSDFYIHNVKYIPLITLTLKVHVKSTAKQQESRKLRHCEAKNISKRTQIKVEESPKEEHVKSIKSTTYKYLDCCIYTIKNLAGPHLKTDMLPIFAALLGNDYIERRCFKKFYAQLGFRGKLNTVAKQQKRIKGVLKWLRHETKESAIEKILSRVPKETRGRLQGQLEGATSGYWCESSEAAKFFGLDEEDFEDEESEDEGSSNDDSEEIELTDVESEDASSFEEDENAEDENAEEVNKDELAAENSDSDVDESAQEGDGIAPEAEDDENFTSSTDLEDEGTDDTENSLSTRFPGWLKQRIYNAELPRYFSDLVHLRMYINNPQVENFLFPDCNETALKILQYIFTVVNQPETPELRYLTRVVRLTNVHYKILQPLELDFTYDPEKVDLENFKAIFYDLSDHEKTFESIDKIPSELQLYFLAIVYWARNTKHSNHIHLQSLLICLVTLWIIDAKVEPIRELKRFQKRYGKTATKARNARDKIAPTNEPNQNPSEGTIETQTTKEVPKKNMRPIQERINFIPKTECILVIENLLKYFHINECFQRRHNDFSSSILHGFSEFQSVFYHLSALNAVFNYPFEPVRVAQCYCGMFLYNMYANLRTRPDIEYYVLRFIFNESQLMTEYYLFLTEWCKDILAILEKNDTKKPSSSKKQAKLKKKAAMANVGKNATTAEKSNDVDSERNSDDSEYNDLNNKYSMLLKV